MALKTRTELKNIWISGATMTEPLFDDVWDSFLNLQDDVDVVFNTVQTPSLQITGGVGSQGTMQWDTHEESISVVLNGTTSHINHDTFYHIRNTTGSTIPKGTPVYANGTVGGSGKITVAPFIADGSIPARLLLGVTTEDIGNNTNGKVADFGRINNFNTSAWNDGDILWASETVAGGWTATEPVAPNLKLAIAFVAYSHSNNGILYVRYTEGHRIVDAHDVEITNPQDKDRLTYNSSNQRWENSPPQDLAYQTVTNATQLGTSSQRLFVNNTGPITITGPVTPVINTIYEIIDANGNAGTHNITFNGNGKTINGNATWVLNQNYYVLKVVYNGTSYNVI